MENKNLHRLSRLFLVLNISFASFGSAWAADGSLDPTFGNGGIVTTDFGGNDDLGLDVEVQPDGRIIIAGASSNLDGNDNDFGLARYNPDGSLDPTFDVDGRLTTSFGDRHDQASAIALRADGKIIAAGHANNGKDVDFALARYNSDGSLDVTFDLDGKVMTPISPYDDYGTDVVPQPDGKILMSGWSHDNSIVGNGFLLVRYNNDGSLDRAFGDQGIATINFGCSAAAHALALQPDGKIIVVGDACNIYGRDFAVARYNSDGWLDTTFDSEGIVVTDFGSSQDSVYGVAVQADGKIVLAGHSFNDTDINIVLALARYNSDGSLDTSFDEDGLVTTDLGGWRDFGYAIALQHDGRILVTGEQWQEDGTVDFALARYNGDGSLDAGFGTGGKVITHISSGDYAAGLALQPDGRILVAGFSDNGFNFDFALARYEVGASVIEVTIDIKPGRPGNRIELEKNICKDDDNLYVAILTTPDFNAIMNTDGTSLTLGDPLSGQIASPVQSRTRDVDRDGDMDVALAFSLCELVMRGALNTNSTELVLRGMTLDGIAISGRDSVNVVGPHRPGNRAPVFIYPVEGQTLDYEGSYLFKVKPIPSAEGFLWGFFQNGVMVWENYRDEGTLSGNEYGIHPGSIAHSKFALGDVDVWVRASINGQWTDATVITIHLQPRTP